MKYLAWAWLGCVALVFGWWAWLEWQWRRMTPEQRRAELEKHWPDSDYDVNV